MKISGAKVLAFFSLMCVVDAARPADRHQFAYLKAVQCKHNPKFLVNVSCFAKSYSRTISTLNIYAKIIRPVTSVMIDFVMEYRYGNIYRDVLHSPFRFDFCYWMLHLDEFRTHPLGNEYIKLLDDSVPGFVRPCPWEEMKLINVTIKTEKLLSLWPSGDYRVVFYHYIGSEDYINITFIGTFRTPLKETFG